jgi:hypothetical protein
VWLGAVPAVLRPLGGVIGKEMLTVPGRRLSGWLAQQISRAGFGQRLTSAGFPADGCRRSPLVS